MVEKEGTWRTKSHESEPHKNGHFY